MGSVELLAGRLIGQDSAPLIYALEEHPAYLGRMRAFLTGLSEGRWRSVVSTLTLVEVLVHPIRQGDRALADRYRTLLLDTRGIRVVPLSTAIAEEAARLRAVYNLRTPDAVQLATAITEGASHFLTNDRRLARVTEIAVLQLDDLPPPGA